MKQDIYQSQLHKLQGGDRGAAPSVASVPPVLAMQAVVRVLVHHQSTLEGGVVRVQHAEGEADEVVVRVAVEQRAMAILSNDSDMLFFHARQALATAIDPPLVTSPHAHAVPRPRPRPHHACVPVTVPLLPFANFHFSAGGRRLVMEALIQRHCLAKATGVRTEVQCSPCSAEECSQWQQ